MDFEEAHKVLTAELAMYRSLAYQQLCDLVGAPKKTIEVVGASGARYYVDTYAAWDGKPNSDVRVCGLIDDGGWRAFVPLSIVFVMEPDGTIHEG
ncbi:MAG: hypothetical protein ACRD2A_02235 [Vicinamibacterales bacterium]